MSTRCVVTNKFKDENTLKNDFNNRLIHIIKRKEEIVR